MNVVSHDLNDWDKDGKIVKVTTVRFDDGQEVRGYDLPPGIENGKPLPEGWQIATSQAGKPYIKVPKAGGGRGGGMPAAFRNTREGFLMEQTSIHRSVALQRAVETVGSKPDAVSLTIEIADQFYAWLQATPGAPKQEVPTGRMDEAHQAPRTGEWGRDPGSDGEGSSGSCSHVFVRGVCKKCGEERS